MIVQQGQHPNMAHQAKRRSSHVFMFAISSTVYDIRNPYPAYQKPSSHSYTLSLQIRLDSRGEASFALRVALRECVKVCAVYPLQQSLPSRALSPQLHIHPN